MEILTMKEVKERLLQSDLGSATDSFNYIIVLKEIENSKYQAYQICVENGKEDIEKREIYMSEYDLITEDVVLGKTYESYDENFIKDNEIVIALTDIEGF